MLGSKIVSIRRVHSETPVELYRRGASDPRKGYAFVEGDYSGFQLRIVAMYSGDKNMIHAFKDLGGDLHSMTAVAVFHPFHDMTLDEFISKKKEKPYKGERTQGKKINFGLCFGMSAYTYASRLRLDWTEDEAKRYCSDLKLKIIDSEGSPDYYLTSATQMRTSYFDAYPAVTAWHKQQHEIGVKDGEIISPFGCRRLVPQLTYMGVDDTNRHSKSSNTRLLSNLDNITKNSVVQTHEATIIMRAMRRFTQWAEENYRPEDRPIICGMIHDAVSYYVRIGDTEAFKKMHEFYEYDYPENLGVPLGYEVEYSIPHGEDPTYWGFGYDEGEGPFYEGKK